MLVSETKDFIQSTCNNLIVTISIFKAYYSAAALIMLLDVFAILVIAWVSVNASIIITVLSLFVCVLFVIWGFAKIMVNYCKQVIFYKNKNGDIGGAGLIMTQNDIVVTGNITGITLLSFVGTIIFMTMLIVIVV